MFATAGDLKRKLDVREDVRGESVEYRFYMVYSDITALDIPTSYVVQADSIEAAVRRFAREYRMKVESVGNGEAWLTLRDGGNVKYLVSEG